MLSIKASKHKVVKVEDFKRRIFIKIKDHYYNTVQDVIFNKEKDNWTCTCYYWSIKQKTCSHIRKAKTVVK